MSTTDPMVGTVREGGRMDAIGFLLMVWKRRKWVAGWVVLTTLSGVVYSLIASPAYVSEATIAARDSDENRGSGLLSQLGGVGSVIAARMSGNVNNLEKVEIILKSNDLAEAVITRYDLMPILFREEWDAVKGTWKPGPVSDRPTLRKGMKKLRENVLGVTPNIKKNVIVVSAQIDDSVMSKRIVEYYVAALNDRIRTDVMRSAAIDRDYLEQQLNLVSDPTLREKIQNLVSAQIEKTMLVRNQAFEMIEKPLVPQQRTRPKRKRIVILSFAFGLFSSIAGVFAWNAASKFLLELRARARDGAMA